MKNNIKIYPESKQTKQEFSLYSEETWLKKKEKFKHLDGLFQAKKGEFFVLATSDKIEFLIGLGKEDKLKSFDLQYIGNKFSYEFREKFKPIPTTVSGLDDSELMQEFIKGLYLGTYKYLFEPSHIFWNEKFELNTGICFNSNEAKDCSDYISALCYGQFAAMDWLNKPANFKTVDKLTEFLKESCKKHSIKFQSFNRKECEKKGLGAFLAVNQGSSQEAAFTIMEYNGGGKNAPRIGLVGKSVLFDTGGISIKPSDNLHYMKSDMGGGAAVIGTILAVAQMQLPVNITAILPITDNAVSERAYLPSDVITAYNGKTIEVLNTDAEGRMTLADGLSYLAKNYKTDVLIDLATLTGSAVRMFGNTCAAYFSNNEELKKDLEDSADKVNQRLWNLPLWEIWEEDFKSDVADFKNISSKPYGDCIIAAKFLEEFIEGHSHWAHLDIAGVAFGNVKYTKEKAATGYGVQLLLDYIEKKI